MNPTFAETARQLAGTLCRLLGWRPADFWAATPAEIASILRTDDSDPGTSLSRGELEALMEQDGNG